MTDDIKALVARLRRFDDEHWRDELHNAAADLIEQLALDAERYRWLRDGEGVGHVKTRLFHAWGPALDAAIDAAREGK